MVVSRRSFSDRFRANKMAAHRSHFLRGRSW
jgi:hypothetical protein